MQWWEYPFWFVVIVQFDGLEDMLTFNHKLCSGNAPKSNLSSEYGTFWKYRLQVTFISTLVEAKAPRVSPSVLLRGSKGRTSSAGATHITARGRRLRAPTQQQGNAPSLRSRRERKETGGRLNEGVTFLKMLQTLMPKFNLTPDVSRRRIISSVISLRSNVTLVSIPWRRCDYLLCTTQKGQFPQMKRTSISNLPVMVFSHANSVCFCLATV